MAKNIVKIIMDQKLSTILVETMELVSGAKKIDYISTGRKYYQRNKRRKSGEINMEKYIKADTVLKFINGCLEHEDKITDIEKAVLTGVKTCIERIPAADVVEVVRCADCKYDERCMFQDFVRDNRVVPYDKTEFFCADGKRKDGRQDE